MQNQLEDFVQSFDPLWQWFGVFLAGAIPYVESYGGAFLGIIVGVPPAIAVISAILGNIVSMLAFVFFGDKINGWRKTKDKPVSEHAQKKRQKLKERFDKYGIIGVSLLGQTLLPSQVTSATMVAFDANRRKVIFWQIISIIMWASILGVLTELLVQTTR